VVLDKTGTLTEGRPVVTDIHWTVPAGSQADLSTILYALEAQSEHPLASAVTTYLAGRNVTGVPLTDFTSVTGKGVTAQSGEETYCIGNRALLTERGITVPDDLSQRATDWQEQAKTVVFFADSQHVLALLAIADPVKATSKQAVEILQKRGIAVYMLTGDNAQTAAAVARQTGLQHYRADVLPADKAQFIEELQRSGKVVAMVGDGINDSQALAQADVSIAMGKGSDIAMDVAKMTLITSDLMSVPKALYLSRRTVQTIRQNLFWAFVYNLIGIPIAAGVLYSAFGFLLSPMLAGAAMALSSVSVVSNSLRLRTVRL
jgi:Cu2+-exporting ATPase